MDEPLIIPRDELLPDEGEDSRPHLQSHHSGSITRRPSILSSFQSTSNLDVSPGFDPAADKKASTLAWWHLPRIMVTEQQAHRVCSTNDLVTDLIYVVILAGLGNGFRTESEPQDFDNTVSEGEANASSKVTLLVGFRDFCALFAPVWFQWNAVQSAINR